MCNFCDRQCSCHFNPPCGFCESHEICAVCEQQVCKDIALEIMNTSDGHVIVLCPTCAHKEVD